jgi:hypothetical protein
VLDERVDALEVVAAGGNDLAPIEEVLEADLDV